MSQCLEGREIYEWMGKLALESQEGGLNLIRNKLWLHLKASEHVNAMIKLMLKEFKYK